jgi:hypothetical protein
VGVGAGAATGAEPGDGGAAGAGEGGEAELYGPQGGEAGAAGVGGPDADPGMTNVAIAAALASPGSGAARILPPLHRCQPLRAATVSRAAAAAAAEDEDAAAVPSYAPPHAESVTVVLAPGAGLELLAPWAVSRRVTPPSIDVTPMLSASEGLYGLRPTGVAGVPVWLGDNLAGPGGVPLAEATGLVILLCGAQHFGEVSVGWGRERGGGG